MDFDSSLYERQSLFILIFLGSVFFGNIYGRFTLPLTIILLPFFAIYLRTIRFTFFSFLPLLACLPVVAQTIAGYPPRKADISVYFAFVYSSMILVGMGKSTLDDDRLRLGLIGGGLFISLVMVLSSVSLLNALDDFYEIKNSMVTPLGSSNYLAVFILFSFTVALFFSRYIVASILAIALFITFSRTGYVMFFITFCIWYVEKKITLSSGAKKILSLLSVAIIICVWILLCINVDSLPQSLANRAELWREAIDQVTRFPLFGVPRSEYLRIFNGLAWDPHNSILNLLILVGVVGLAIYGYYLYIVVSTFRKLAHDSLIWKSIYYAVSVSLIWSLFEVILLTPAYDILLAVLFCFARSREKDLGIFVSTKIQPGGV
jgi:hypothetical protein